MTHSLFEGYYDADLAFDLYKAYKESSSDKHLLNELLHQFGLLVGKVFLVEFGTSIEDFDKDVLLSEALEHLYLVVANNDPISSPSAVSFMNYMWRAAKNSMLQGIRKLHHQEFDFWKVCSEPHQSSLPTYKNAESSIYIQQLRKMAFRIFVADLRFVGREQEACIFMARCIMYPSGINPTAAAAMYKLSKQKTRYLFQYTKYLLQRSIFLVEEVEISENKFEN